MIKYLRPNDGQKRSIEWNIDEVYRNENLVMGCEVISLKVVDEVYEVYYCFDGPNNEYRTGHMWFYCRMEKSGITDFEEYVN
jgi:hypothetical protein